MARYRNEMDDDRGYHREDRSRRENFDAWDDPSRNRRQFETERRPDYNQGRFGERAQYNYDEPRYGDYSGGGERFGNERFGNERFGNDRFDNDRYGNEGRRSSLYDIRGDLSSGTSRDYHASEHSRLRCRDIMTRELVVATRDTTIPEISLMMKQEDTGVIPVVEYDVQQGGNGRTEERKYEGRNYTRGKLIGLITDRDIVVRAVAENKDCASIRAEEIMSVDIHTARPNDRVVDVIRKMGDKQVRRIPVTNDNGYLVGMISMGDVAVETRQDRELSDALEEISKGSSFWNRIFG